MKSTLISLLIGILCTCLAAAARANTSSKDTAEFYACFDRAKAFARQSKHREAIAEKS
jgi:hypothetical protein